MRKVVFRIIITIAAFALVGCGTSGGSSVMYPEPVQSGSAIKSDTAIVLVGNGGSDVINYLQFEHSGLPAINARGITLAPGGMVAIPVPVGTSRLSLSNYTASRRPGGYLPNGMAMGYVPVRTPPIEINSPGLYYVATILPDQQPNFESKPSGAQLAKWRKERPELSSIKPVNFSWSN